MAIQNHGRVITGWTGPDDDDLDASGIRLVRPVPPERWPYGPPSAHETCCMLHRGHNGGLYCDCKASDASDDEWGEGGLFWRS